MAKIKQIHAREIIDSRGNPTVEVDVTLETGAFGRAAVPSGASTGSLEALELRDGEKRFHGKGVKKAVSNVNQIIAKALNGADATKQNDIDNKMRTLDNTKNKANLGANAILGVSIAVAKAAAANNNIPFFEYINSLKLTTNPKKQAALPAQKFIMPMPMMNIINGGQHADNLVDIQEFMIMPAKASSCADSIRIGAEIFHNLKKILHDSGHSTNVGDEGGFAPNLKSSDEALGYIMRAIEKSGFKAGDDIVIALDSASTEFYKDGIYDLAGENLKLDYEQMIKYYEKLVASYPIVSIEDAMSEDDHKGWAAITEVLGKKIQLVGDDLFVTNPEILRAGIQNKLANAVLVKINQIGTLSETLETVKIAHEAGYNAILSHRSGETEDTSIAHIAVATNCGQIKTGSLSRSDRLAKYNELIRIEEYLGDRAVYLGLQNE